MQDIKRECAVLYTKEQWRAREQLTALVDLFWCFWNLVIKLSRTTDARTSVSQLDAGFSDRHWGLQHRGTQKMHKHMNPRKRYGGGATWVAKSSKRPSLLMPCSAQSCECNQLDVNKRRNQSPTVAAGDRFINGIKIIESPFDILPH